MMKPFTTAEHLEEVAKQRASIRVRADYARRWLDCANAPAGATDADADGVPWCKDCNDADPAVKPGAGCLL
jgi:hypothetical protein